MKINAIIKELKKYDKITDYAIDEQLLNLVNNSMIFKN